MKDRFGQYQHLAGDDDDDGLRTPSKPNLERNLLRKFGVVALLSLALVAGFAAGSICSIKSLWLSKPKVTYCGHTSSQARAAGCVLEPMVYGWMPPQCQYPDVTGYNDLMKWPWYADENMTLPLSEEQVWKGESVTLWTNKPGYHTEHCLFLYRKLMYGMEHKVKWLDKKTLGSEHAYHCVEGLSKGPERETRTTFVELGMYTCEKTIWYE